VPFAGLAVSLAAHYGDFSYSWGMERTIVLHPYPHAPEVTRGVARRPQLTSLQYCL
jgi:hypothetical protein